MTRPSQRERLLAWIRGVLAWWLGMPCLVRWIGVVAVMSVLWWSSSRVPVVGEPSLTAEVLHNAMHLVAFGGLAMASWCACRESAGGNGRAASRIAMIIAVGYGIVDEVHQGWVPGRVCSTYDVLTDACGASAAVWMMRVVRGDSLPRAWHAVLLVVFAMLAVVLATFG